MLFAGTLAACRNGEAESEPLPAAKADSELPYFEPKGGRVRDLAQILSPEFEQHLTAMLDAAEADFGPQMAVVTVSSLEGMEIDDFSLRYANAWELGDAARDDGLLLLVAPNEHKVRIEVGTGIESSFTDAFAQQVLADRALPAFRNGQYEDGIIAATQALINNMRAHPTVPANDNPSNRPEDEAA